MIYRSMKIIECPLRPNAQDFAPYSFADCFMVETSKVLNAEDAARIALENGPKWIGDLMKLRNLIVKPLGLKTDEIDLAPDARTIGMFPILKNTNSQIIMGLDDIHLDFRIVVEVEQIQNGSRIYTTTYVKTHNLLGKTYLFTIKPFHKLIVATSLRNLL